MQYNDISPATQAYVDRALLKRAQQNNILGQFGQNKVLPSKSTKTSIFRRYNRLPAATVPLQEGVTPSGKTLTKTDISVTIQQYGDFITVTDVILDTHTDPVLQESQDILGEQAGETWDVLRFGVLKAGTNVMYSTASARNTVNTVFSRDQLRTAVRILKKQLAKPITNIVKAGPNIGTTPIPKSFIAVCHTDAQPDFERLTGWIPVQAYPTSMGLIEGEIGSIGELRVVCDNNCLPFPDAGTTKGSTLSTTGTNSDVYPILIFGADAYGTVALAGKNAVSTFVNNPKSITGDELAQRGSVGWKGYTATVILQDAFMLRLETALLG
jgi:N4-gp56 family major capsid protein